MQTNRHSLSRPLTIAFYATKWSQFRSGKMPKYQILIADGEQMVDVGDLPDVTGAKRHAAVILGKILQPEPEELWSMKAFRIVVSDQDGLILFSLDAFGTDAPALLRS